MLERKIELMESILGESANTFTKEYVETEFDKCYNLVYKIMNNLGQEEKELLLKVCNEYDDMHKFVKYFLGGRKQWKK